MEVNIGRSHESSSYSRGSRNVTFMKVVQKHPVVREFAVRRGNVTYSPRLIPSKLSSLRCRAPGGDDFMIKARLLPCGHDKLFLIGAILDK